MLLNSFRSGSRLLAAAALAACVAGEARSQTSTSVQGVLRSENGQPVSGPSVLRFSLYSSPTGGTPLQQTQQAVDVSQGVFSASPGFDPQLFGATEERWLEFGVETAPGVFQALTPRQRIGAAPLALTIPGLQVTPKLVIDQSVPNSNSFAIPLLNDGIHWQSFTTGGAGEVRAVEAGLQNTSSADATITATLYRGLGVEGVPVAVTTAILPAVSATALRFTFPAAAAAAAEDVFTVQLSSPAPVIWFVQRNSGYSRGSSNFEPNADYAITTYLSNRAASSEFEFKGSVTATTVRGSYAFFNEIAQATTLIGVNANITDTLTAGAVSAGTISANSINANTFNVPTLTSSFFSGQSMALTTNAGIGLANPSPDVRLEISKQSVGSGWHMYVSNPGAPAQFNRTGMRVSDAGFFEVSNALAGSNFARLSGTGAWSAVSDARLKSDVSPAEGLLDAALKLRPVNFRWIADGKPDMGFIAQEVRGVLPGLVVGDEKSEMLTVDYSHLSVVAIGALQELARDLRAENQRLRAEIEQINTSRVREHAAAETEMSTLRTRLERLEAAMVRAQSGGIIGAANVRREALK